MNLDFAAVLAALGPDASFRIANAARPPSEYLFASLLPETPMWDYNVKSGTMTIRPTMAGLAALDSPYPPGGVISASTFLSESAKIANQVELNEYTLRQLQQMMLTMTDRNLANDALQNEVLNFLDLVIIQAHMDTMEYLRGQALVFGAINWAFNQLHLVVDYGIPVANILATRTGTASWDSSASAFWTDIRSLRSALRYNVRAFIAHPDTINAVVLNEANNMEIVSQSGFNMTIRRTLTGGGLSTDARDSVSFISYGNEAEIMDLVNPGETIKVPFMPRGYLLAVGAGQSSGYRVGMGAVTSDPTVGALGYTHLAPTVEGGGRPGRWAELYVPQTQPMKLHGRGVTNGLPVIETPQSIAVAKSDLATLSVDIP